MVKKVILLLCLGMLLTACQSSDGMETGSPAAAESTEASVTETKPEETAAETVSPEETVHPQYTECIRAYQQFLSDYRVRAPQTQYPRAFGLACLNADTLPELILEEFIHGARPGMEAMSYEIYTWNPDSGAVEKLSPDGTESLMGNGFYYQDGQGMFVLSRSMDTSDATCELLSESILVHTVGDTVTLTHTMENICTVHAQNLDVSWYIDGRNDFASPDLFLAEAERIMPFQPDRRLVTHELTEKELALLDDDTENRYANEFYALSVRELLSNGTIQQRQAQFRGEIPLTPVKNTAVSINTVLSSYQKYMDSCAEQFEPDTWRYALAYIDGDDIPEMLVAKLEDDQVQVYRYHEDGYVTFTGLYGTGGRLEYLEYGDRIYHTVTGKKDDILHTTNGLPEKEAEERKKTDNLHKDIPWTGNIRAEGFFDIHGNYRYVILQQVTRDPTSVMELQNHMSPIGGRLDTYSPSYLDTFYRKLQENKQFFRYFDTHEEGHGYHYDEYTVKKLYNKKDCLAGTVGLPES